MNTHGLSEINVYTTACLLDEGLSQALNILAVKICGGFIKCKNPAVETERLSQSQSDEERR